MVVAALVWILFIAGYNADGWLNEWWLLAEAGLCLATGGLAIFSASRYRSATGSRKGYAVAAVLLFLMAGYTFTRTGIIGVGVLTAAAVTASILALAAFERPVPGKDADADDSSTPDRPTLCLWVATAACIALSVVVLPLGATWLSGVVPVSEALRADFNLLGLLFAPIVAVLVLAHGVLCWFLSSRIEQRALRLAAIAAATLVALLLPLAIGLGAAAPFTFLTFQLPVAATCLYTLFDRSPRLLRVLGVAALGAALGLFLFVLGGVLVGAETD